MTAVRATSFLIVDDHRIVRDTLREILDDPGRRIDEASTLPHALDYLQVAKPDLIILGGNLRHTDGPRALSTLHTASPSSAIIYLGSHQDPLYAVQALEHGASTYLLKEQAAEEIGQAVEALLAAT